MRYAKGPVIVVVSIAVRPVKPSPSKISGHSHPVSKSVGSSDGDGDDGEWRDEEEEEEEGGLITKNHCFFFVVGCLDRWWCDHRR